MKSCKITVMKKAFYKDLSDIYENPIQHACDMELGDSFISVNGEKPDSFCDSAWASIEYFVKELANGGGRLDEKRKVCYDFL